MNGWAITNMSGGAIKFSFAAAEVFKFIHSELSDECIDFTMLCVFFVSVHENINFSDSKVNLVGALGRSFFEFPNSFQNHREKPKKKKLRKNVQIFTKSVENTKMCKIKNTTLIFLQFPIIQILTTIRQNHDEYLQIILLLRIKELKTGIYANPILSKIEFVNKRRYLKFSNNKMILHNHNFLYAFEVNKRNSSKFFKNLIQDSHNKNINSLR
ncbi:Uncharacterized protein FWK35_00006880 [Aphis craccivora]|uniref:Uncharacterized protein n=1 Tax=Aphis craccivora TaxID=307492 RepID=A0A6G0YTC4_APHCR|nr:Uncharacterized protein FWK35_00006880 [Aphis craccivora]